MKALRHIKNFVVYFNRKTIYFNFHYLPFRTAMHLPVFVSRNTKLKCMKGTVQISGTATTGMIRIGTNEIGIYDRRHNRPVWENAGVVIFRGTAVIKYGVKIVVGKEARLKLGNNFRISSGSYVICYKSIEFGDDCRISWDSQIIDTDFHRILDSDRNHINPDKEIKIGNNCWIGNHSLVLKGTRVGNMVVVASNSLINRSIPENNIILAGSPAKIIRTSITWEE
jgi:acetyltransferase-like isoleucine patch superfamily enzyme